jgi:hypothetical protein
MHPIVESPTPAATGLDFFTTPSRYTSTLDAEGNSDLEHDFAPYEIYSKFVRYGTERGTSLPRH